MLSIAHKTNLGKKAQMLHRTISLPHPAMKTASNPSHPINHPRKPTRRARTPQRSSRHPMPSNNHNNNSSTPSRPSPSSSPPNNVWRHEDILAIAQAVHDANDVDPAKLFPGSNAQLPDTLRHKSREQVIAVVEQLHKAFDKSIVPFAPPKSVPNFLAVLASEIIFMKQQRKKRDEALEVLNKARSERKLVERNRQRLVAESKALTKQIQDQRTRRTRAIEKKAEEEAKLDHEKQKLEEQRQHYELLRHNLEQAKLAELDIRRRLDRMRLKVAAMRGEMIIPTVDKLSTRHTPKWLGDFDDSLISGTSEPKNGKDSAANEKTPPKSEVEKPDVEIEAIVATEDIESPTHSVKDDLELDESNEEIEFRLLKNRLAMCEMEAEEWKQCVESERQKVRLITRSKARLEEELARLKHGSGNKATGSGSGRGVGKSASSSAKATAKLRAAIRASLAPPPESGVRKPIRKSRKGRPKRALVPEIM